MFCTRVTHLLWGHLTQFNFKISVSVDQFHNQDRDVLLLQNNKSSLNWYLSFQTSKQRADAIRTSWGRDHDKECGALLEIGQIVIPFNKDDPGSKKKSKSIRKAMYVTAKIGSNIKDSECFIVNNTGNLRISYGPYDMDHIPWTKT